MDQYTGSTPAVKPTLGSTELYDPEGYRVPWVDIPDELYFPEPFEPTPEDEQDACLQIENAAVARALRAARGVVTAAICDFANDLRLPPHTEHAMARLDEALMAVESIATVPDDPDPMLTAAMAMSRPKAFPYQFATPYDPSREDGDSR